MTDKSLLKQQLTQLEQELRQQSLWSRVPPSDSALSSREPFAVDSLSPEQWLQWIFLPRMNALIEQNLPLPTGFSISPYFEECWKTSPGCEELIGLLQAIDRTCK